MSGHTIFVWDATYGMPEAMGLATVAIPEHDTQTDNYRQFIQTVKAFIDEVEKHYPELSCDGIYALKNGVYIEPMPYEMTRHCEDIIIETAVNNGLCVEMESGYYTPDNQSDYPIGKAQEKWQQHLKAEVVRLAQINDSEELPEGAKEKKQYIKNLVKSRCDAMGFDIKGSGPLFKKKFGEITLELELKVNQMGEMSAYIAIDSKKLDEVFRTILISYQSYYKIPMIDRRNTETELGDDELTHIHQAIDMLIAIYPHAHSYESLYNYLSDTQNNPHLRPAFTSGPSSNPYDKYDDYTDDVPIKFGGLIALAKLANLPNYEELKAKHRQEHIDWFIKRYHFYNKMASKRGDTYTGLGGDDFETYIPKMIDRQIERIDSVEI